MKKSTVPDYIEERTLALACYMIEARATVRETAKKFGISKSTVHKDMTSRLKHINSSLYKTVSEVLAENKAVRHLRGGEATKQKYAMRKSRIADRE